MTQGAEDATFKLFEKLYNDYVGKLGPTWDALTKRILDAQKQVNDAATGWGAAPNPMQKMEEAQKSYTDAVRAAWIDSQKEHTAAYEEYVRGFRDALGKADLASLTPMAFTMVAQSGIIAAGYAGSILGNHSLVAWSGVPPWALSPDPGSQAPKTPKK